MGDAAGVGGVRDVELVVLPDAGAAAAAVAALLAEAVEAGGSIVLAGGSTPRKAYELAAALDGDWGGVDLWFGDDRCVPADDPLSNQLLVRDALLDRIIVHPTVHAIATDSPQTRLPPRTTPSCAASRSTSSCSASARTATPHRSFPTRPLWTSTSAWRSPRSPGLEPFVERVTMTIPALESGAHVVFLAVGEEKADAVRRAFAADAVDVDPGEPRALARGQDDRHPRRCGCFASALSRVRGGVARPSAPPRFEQGVSRRETPFVPRV